MCQPINSRGNGFLPPFNGRHVGYGHLAKAMSLIHGRNESLIACCPKSGKTDCGSVFDKDFNVVGSVGNLLIDKFDCFIERQTLDVCTLTLNSR
jgi:hypothetical protein